MPERVIPFYHETDENGCFSNWYPTIFQYAGINYTSTEQFMMFQKVRMFNQYALADSIMKTDDPKEQKHLGRTKFPEFNAAVWDSNCYTIVKRGIRAKFQQNPVIKDILLNTGDAVLVEASPLDRIWGVGIGAKKAVDVTTWQGKNLLGRALMEVREDLHTIPDYVDFKNAESIDVWKWHPAELLSVPHYHNTVRAYRDTFTDPVLFAYFDGNECTFEGIEEAMHTNMGGGFPVAGFWEMKQEIYDIHRMLHLQK